MVLVARKSAGIRTAADLGGQKVGLWGGDLAIPARAFFDRHGLNVEAVPQSATVNLFLRGGVKAASADADNEYHLLFDAGLDPDELTVFRLEEGSLNIPEDGLYALEKTIERDPNLADAFSALRSKAGRMPSPTRKRVALGHRAAGDARRENSGQSRAPDMDAGADGGGDPAGGTDDRRFEQGGLSGRGRRVAAHGPAA